MLILQRNFESTLSYYLKTIGKIVSKGQFENTMVFWFHISKHYEDGIGILILDDSLITNMLLGIEKIYLGLIISLKVK